MTDEELVGIALRRTRIWVEGVDLITAEGLPAINAVLVDHDRLLAEVRRLRGLIANVEQVDNDFGTMFCPWCGYGETAHVECPAFVEKGVVR
jgi:hypothetical protein